MFWEFQGAIVSQIDTLLDNENVTLNELMEEDDILQECKASNQKLLSFLTKPAVLEELIGLATSEPVDHIKPKKQNSTENPPCELVVNEASSVLETDITEESDEKTRYEKANIACELLTSDVSSITDALICNKELLSKLYTFIESEKQLNPLLASFFSKTMSLLFVKRSELLFEFLKTKEEFVSHVLKHIETSAVMDFLLKLIAGTDNNLLRFAISKWLHEKKLIRMLISIFGINFSAEAQANSAQLMCDIIKTIRDYQSTQQDNAEPDVLLQDIESTSTVSELLNEIFNTRSESSIVCGISVLQSLLEYKRHSANIQQQIQQQSTLIQSNIQAQNEDFEGVPMASNPIFSRMELTGSDQMTALDAERLSRCVQQVHAAIIPRLSDFHIILLNPPERPAIHTTVGVIEKPLGATRLEVVHLIRALLSSNNPGINQKISELKTVPVLIDLFFSYPWNNFLHTQVEQSIKSILNNSKSNSPVTSPTVADGVSTYSSQEVTSLLVDQLFSDARLIERIVDVWESYHADETSTKQPRPGYMGHVIKIANNIVLNKDQDAVLNATKLISDEYKQKWDFFVDKTLSDINKRMQTPLVNEVPTSTAFDKNAIRQQENALQQAFIEYQMQQMTRSLCTQIEFSAAEFNEIDDNIQAPVDHMSRVNYNLENQLESSRNVDVFEQMCAERIRTSLDSNSSDEEDLWESTDRDMSFTRSNMSENRNQSSIQVFGSNSGDVTEIKMDVDQTDAWNDVASSNVTSSVLDPWASPKESNSKEKLVSDSSWADFSTFNDFHSSQAAPPNMCISVSSVMPSSSDTSIFPSSEDPGITSVTADSELRENNEDLDVGCEVSNVVEEKDSEVSSTIDNVLNGPH